MFNEREYQKQYRVKNKEKLRKQHHEYYIKNKKKCLISAKKWRDKFPEKMYKYKKKYEKKNYDRIIARSKKWYYEHREYAIKRVKKYALKRYKKYPWIKVYTRIQCRVKHNPSYIRNGIKNLLTKEDIKFLWFRDKAYKMQLPSIDRIDGYGNYTKDNCRFLEYTENIKRPKVWRRQYICLKNLGNTGRTHFKKGHIPWCKGKKRPEISGENHWTKKGKAHD